MGVEEEPWKWAPILLLSPIPWAFISLIVMGGGQIVLNVAQTDCTDPSSNTVDTSLMVAGISMGIVAAYMFLGLFTWIWLGHNVYLVIPIPKGDWKNMNEWGYFRKRIMWPITQLKFVLYSYVLIGLISFLSGILLSAGVGNAAYLCTSQTPLLISFSSFIMILYWCAIGITLIRIVSMLYYSKLKDAIGVQEGEKQPDNDIDMVRTIFKSYDQKGTGEIESKDLGQILETLGMDCSDEEVQDILYEIDNDNSGNITLAEFESWYMRENDAKKKKKKKQKKVPEFEEEEIDFNDLADDLADD